MLGGEEAREGHQPWRGGEAACITEFGGDGERREVIDAAKAPEPIDARPERREGEELPQFGVDGLEPGDGFVDRPDIRVMRLLECRDRPPAAPAARRRAVLSRPFSSG
jgi:hypothetical protein